MQNLKKIKLLLTGAFHYTEEQLEQLKNSGFEITFIQNERVKTDIDCSEFEAVVCNGFFLYNDIERFRSLKMIQATSAGLDRLPLDFIKKNGIMLKNARGVYSIPMAEWCICRILDIYKYSCFFDENQKNKVWQKHRGLRELSGKRAVILGAGDVGSRTAERLKAFGVKITAADKVKPQYDIYDEYCKMEDLDTVLKESDIIIITLPLTSETRGIFDERRLGILKADSILINMARGGIVDEKALVSALKKGAPGYAVLDVFEEEPLDKDSILWDIQNLIISPHNSFVSEKNNERMFEVIYKNLNEYFCIVPKSVS